MPVYEYECLKCGAHFDELQRLSDLPVRKHNGCGGRAKRVPSSPAIQFKGTGWYVTDYGRPKSGGAGDDKKDAGSDAKVEAKAAGEKSASAKSEESKPAAKPTKS